MEFLRGGQEVTFVARGGSMWPAVRDGAQLVIKPLKIDLLRVGDLAAVDRRGELVVHRVIARTPTEVTLQGDAMPSPDGAFTAQSVLGVATVRAQPPLRAMIPTRWHLAALARWARRAFAERFADPTHQNAARP